MTRVIPIIALLLMLAAPASFAQPTKAELQVRFKARDTELRDLKQKGRVGETIDGYVDAVEADAAADRRIADLIRGENDDRRLLYQILADEINRDLPEAEAKATPQTVAARNARRNVERARPDEWLRVAKDHWIRIRDFPRFERLTRLKTQGKVGENREALVEGVRPEDRTDPAVTSVIKEENDARTAEYKALAEKEGVDIASITARMARRNYENARVGDMLKNDDGTWRKK